MSLILIVVAVVAVPFGAALLTGRTPWVIAVGAALAIVEWVVAYSDASDPASGSEWSGAGLVAFTGIFALLGLGVWTLGAVVGGLVRRRRAGTASPDSVR